MIRITVLVHEFVTGGGLAGGELPHSWAAEGRAMRRALAEDFVAIEGVSVVMTLDDRFPGEPGPWSVVRIRAGEEPATFARLAARCDYTLCVAPETGRVLEDRARMIEQAGGRSLGCSPEAIALCGDKLRLADHFGRLAIPTPPSRPVAPRHGLPRDHPYPAVLKPIDGAGTLDTYYIESPDDLPEAVRTMTEALLQPFATGSAMSAAFLIAASGEPRLVGVAEQHVEQRGGRFRYLGGRMPADSSRLAPVVDAVRSVPGLRGWVGVDFVRDYTSGGVVVLEINPRATTSYVGWREVGTEAGILAHAWLRGAVGLGLILDAANSLLPTGGEDGRRPGEGDGGRGIAEVTESSIVAASAAPSPCRCAASLSPAGERAPRPIPPVQVRFSADGRVEREGIPS